MAGNGILPQEIAEFNRYYVGLLLEDRLFVLWDRVHANRGELLRQSSCVLDLARGPQHLVELLEYFYENPEELPGRAMENDDAVERPALDVLVQFNEGIFERPCMLRQQSRERSVSPGTRSGSEPQRDDAAGPSAGDDCSHGEENELENSARQHELEQSIAERSREAPEEFAEPMIFWSCNELPPVDPLMPFMGEPGLIAMCGG
ncbi:hypothetical protein EJ03DRAFT_327497 [Teratosphaeria nubilosa]|uniref:Uncharacterized protein n=1 Tax=Teratosphaeria nubilosa TaxID=161662 RepID=A0A6G1LAH1_9PEZI|nr:hypothetical protein EJ03DRAFT_327497 [Teratosphaeria nubilosa]